MRIDDYKFLQIADAVSSVNQRVNLIGVVIDSGLPKSTQGTDVFCSLRLIDETRSSIGVYVHFFAETMEKLPQVNSAGDILLVSQVMMKVRGSEVYAQYNKKYSTFAIFEGRDISSDEIVPYQASLRYKAREHDNKLVKELRDWISHYEIEGLNDSCPLKDIKEGEGSNLLCKILHVHEVQDSWMLFVWDGTDVPPNPVEAKLEDERENPLPLQLERSPLSREILCTFPAVGTVLRMMVDQSSKKIGMNYIHANRWVKFVGLKFEVHAASWNAVLMPFSKLCYLRDDDDRVLELQRSYDERIKSRWGRMPSASFPWPSKISETSHPDVPFVTLMNVLTHQEVIGKFKCVVRVVAMLPWEADDFRSLSGIFRVRLTLEDPTSRIHAFLYAEDGITFFGDDESTESLTRKRDLLLGFDEGDDAHATKRNPPWIQCCLKAYYADESDIWGSRNYRIFDTELVDVEINASQT